MNDPHNAGADIFFVGKDEIDWREEEETEDPDDLQVETPVDVTLVLGFDPTTCEDVGCGGKPESLANEL